MCKSKICAQCKLDVPLEDYHKHKRTKDGLNVICKSCAKANSREWNAKNKARKAERDADYYLKNKEVISSKQKDYYLANADTVKQKVREYRLNNLEKCKQRGAEYFAKNKEMLAKRSAEYRAANKEKIRIAKAEYAARNKVKLRKYIAEHYLKTKDEYLARAALRRALLLQATPKWLSKSQKREITDMFKAAKMFQIYTGTEYHVDHIVPLQGETVCGLHVPWNLQLLPWDQNISKGNRHWPDMPETTEQKEQVI